MRCARRDGVLEAALCSRPNCWLLQAAERLRSLSWGAISKSRRENVGKACWIRSTAACSAPLPAGAAAASLTFGCQLFGSCTWIYRITLHVGMVGCSRCDSRSWSPKDHEFASPLRRSPPASAQNPADPRPRRLRCVLVRAQTNTSRTIQRAMAALWHQKKGTALLALALALAVAASGAGECRRSGELVCGVAGTCCSGAPSWASVPTKRHAAAATDAPLPPLAPSRRLQLWRWIGIHGFRWCHARKWMGSGGGCGGAGGAGGAASPPGPQAQAPLSARNVPRGVPGVVGSNRRQVSCPFISLQSVALSEHIDLLSVLAKLTALPRAANHTAPAAAVVAPAAAPPAGLITQLRQLQGRVTLLGGGATLDWQALPNATVETEARTNALALARYYAHPGLRRWHPLWPPAAAAPSRRDLPA